MSRPPPRRRRIQLTPTAPHRLVRESVKPIAPHAVLDAETRRGAHTPPLAAAIPQKNAVSNTATVRDIAPQTARAASIHSQRLGIVQRRQLRQLPNVPDNRVIDARRPGESRTPMHDPMGHHIRRRAEVSAESPAAPRGARCRRRNGAHSRERVGAATRRRSVIHGQLHGGAAAVEGQDDHEIVAILPYKTVNGVAAQNSLLQQ